MSVSRRSVEQRARMPKPTTSFSFPPASSACCRRLDRGGEEDPVNHSLNHLASIFSAWSFDDICEDGGICTSSLGRRGLRQQPMQLLLHHQRGQTGLRNSRSQQVQRPMQGSCCRLGLRRTLQSAGLRAPLRSSRVGSKIRGDARKPSNTENVQFSVCN